MMDHATLPAMVREAVTLRRMYEMSHKMWDVSYTEMVALFPKQWDMVTDYVWGQVNVEAFTISQWDELEELDNWLHDRIFGWATFLSE